jgi:alpha-beta hydrolase superfamily lysophospholipase
MYVDNGYDIIYLDYRGYGKSSGTIKSEEQLIQDAQIAYDYLKANYAENEIILSGTSIGTGIAAKIAALNNPQSLILVSPYYSFKSLIKQKVPIIPVFIIKYRFETNKELAQVKCPIVIFHGDQDNIIPFLHSKNLKKGV